MTDMAAKEDVGARTTAFDDETTAAGDRSAFWPRKATGLSIIVALYALLAVAGFKLSPIDDPMAGLWLANGAAAGCLWRLRPSTRRLLGTGIGLCAVLYFIVAGFGFVGTIAATAGTLLHIAATTLVTAKLARRDRIHLHDTGVLAAVVVCVPALSALAQTLLVTLVAAPGTPGTAETWWIFWLSGALGTAVALPISLAIADPGRVLHRGGRLAESLAIALCCLVLAGLFGMQGHASFALVFILLVAASVRLSPIETALTSSLAVLIVIALQGIAPLPAALAATPALALTLPLPILVALPYIFSRVFQQHRTDLQSLRASETRFRGAMDHAAIGMAIVAPSGLIIEANRSFAEMLGRSQSEMAGIDFRDITYPEDLSHDIGQLQRVLDGAIDSYRMEKRYLTSSARIVWCNLSVSAVRHPETRSVINLIAQVENIDTRKRAEAALSDNESRLSFALESARHGVWDRDLVAGTTYYSPMWSALLGLTQEEVGDRENIWLELIHPEDRTRALQLDVDCISGKADSFVAEFRMRHRDGRWIWILDRGRVLSRDANGRATRMIGTHADITARKEAEQDLRKLSAALYDEKERLRVTLYSIGDGVICADTAGRVTFVNPTAEQLTGWNAQEALGRPIGDILQLRDGLSGAELPNPIDVCLREARPYHLRSDAVMITRRGDTRNVQDSAAPIRNAEGEIQGVVLVFQDITKARALEAELAQSARLDALTGLPNRLALEQSLEEARGFVRASSRKFTLGFIDLDRFKILNDSAGHEAGNALLVAVASKIRSVVAQHGLTVRLGGDEFAILLNDLGIEEAEATARALCCGLASLDFSWAGKSFQISASIGLAELIDGDIGVSELMSRADVACYTAKLNGRNRVCVYRADDGDAGRYHRDIQIASGIRAAIAEDRFRIFAQRIEYLQEHTPGRRYFEILLRLQDENGKLLLPGAFIPAAERYDLMGEIDRWVVSTTLRRYGPRLALTGDFGLAINLSANSLNDPNLWAFVRNELEVSGIEPNRLHFEITETALINNMAAANDFVAQARATGCGITLDDFGAGLSSFSYLRQFPVDELKIDGNFIRQIKSSAVDRAIVESINELGHKFGAHTIAEFVEDLETLELLRNMGIDMAQGYAIARPIPIEDVLDALAAGA